METGDFDSELASRLDELSTRDGYRVERILKQSESEQTQLVYLVVRDGSERGPFVRKIMSGHTSLGNAYEAVFAAQKRGVRLVHLPRIYECTRVEGRFTVVMEYVSGETLGTYVGRLDDSDARLDLVRTVFPDLCDAVSELHERFSMPIIHRDLKPSNVMVTQAGVTLIDLGISRIFKSDAEQDTTHFGTRAYAPPEQFGFGQTSVRSDIYSLGMLLFFCLTGREATSHERMSGFTTSDISAALREVIVRATQFDPDARYASVREFKKKLIEACGNKKDQEEKERGVSTSIPMDMPQPAVSKEPESKPVSISQRSLLSRIPKPLGIIWNVFVLLSCALVIAGTIMAYLVSTPQNVTKPAWYAPFSYFFCIIPLTVIVGYLLLDRRPLRRRIPVLANLTVKYETTMGLKAIVAIFAMWIVATIVEIIFVG